MSTSYYRFKSPITSISIVTEGPHDKISVWVSHQLSGVLIVDEGVSNDILKIFKGDKVLHAWCGAEREACVKKFGEIDGYEYVVSEYNEICTVEDVLAGRVLRGGY
jgi:hypothetical protein